MGGLQASLCTLKAFAKLAGNKIRVLKKSVAMKIRNPKDIPVTKEFEELANIEDVRAGDYVLSWNEKSKKTGYAKVLNTFVRKTDLIYTLKAGKDSLETTWNQPFWVVESGIGDQGSEAERIANGEQRIGASLSALLIIKNYTVESDIKGHWVQAKDLRAGDTVMKSDGTLLKIESITSEKRTETVYNFEVAGNHTYFVGEEGVLVHNANGYNRLNTLKNVVDEKNKPKPNEFKTEGYVNFSDADKKALEKSIKKNGSFILNDESYTETGDRIQKGSEFEDYYGDKFSGKNYITRSRMQNGSEFDEIEKIITISEKGIVMEKTKVYGKEDSFFEKLLGSYKKYLPEWLKSSKQVLVADGKPKLKTASGREIVTEMTIDGKTYKDEFRPLEQKENEDKRIYTGRAYFVKNEEDSPGYKSPDVFFYNNAKNLGTIPLDESYVSSKGHKVPERDDTGKVRKDTNGNVIEKDERSKVDLTFFRNPNRHDFYAGGKDIYVTEVNSENYMQGSTIRYTIAKGVDVEAGHTTEINAKLMETIIRNRNTKKPDPIPAGTWLGDVNGMLGNTTGLHGHYTCTVVREKCIQLHKAVPKKK